MNSFALSRRRLLQSASAGVLGMSLPQLLSLQARGAVAGGKAPAKRVLVILEQGGMSQMDTFDPKPDVVAEHRSPHGPISTTVPGMQFTALLPHTAQVAHKLSVIRSMYHPKQGANGHGEGTQYMLCGAHPNTPIPMPDLGCVATKILGTDCPQLPPYIMVPGNHEQNAVTRTGFLPASTKVFKTGGRDLSDPNWKVNDLLPRGENASARFAARQQMLGSLDRRFLGAAQVGRKVDGMDRFYEQAFDTLTNSQVAKAFDLNSEPAEVRERYGKGHRGACYLVGRKLMEAGVRFVTVDTLWPLTEETPGGFIMNWDHHDLIYAPGSCGTVRDKAGGEGRYGIGHWVMTGSTDRAFAALIGDLDERGLLAETLVCLVSEFGRTPRLNKFAGRDHWTETYSIVMAGAGVPGGQIVGKSDADGGYAIDDPHTPEEYGITIYEKLGIDCDVPLYDATNRPIYFGHAAEPIKAVM